MKLEKFRETYRECSGKASEVTRTLALSGVALIWVFAIQGDSGYKLPRGLLWPSVLIVLTLLLDLLQYVFHSLIYGAYARILEHRETSEDTELAAPPWFNWPALVCFWSKLGTIAWAYAVLLRFLWSQLFG